MNAIGKWSIILTALLGATTVGASPVKYVFTGISTGGEPCDTGTVITGTLGVDFSQEYPAESTGTVGSPVGWISVATGGITTPYPAPNGFVFAIVSNSCVAYDLSPNGYDVSSTVSVGPAGLSGNFNLGYQGLEGSLSFTNPSGRVAVDGLPLFDEVGTGTGFFGGGTFGIHFTVTSITRVPDTVEDQLGVLAAEVAASGAPELDRKVAAAAAHVKETCHALHRLLRDIVHGDDGLLSTTAAAQVAFDAEVAEVDIGCK